MELFDMPNPSIILIGPTCSGKTTLAKHLEGMGYERIITYTTRPMRDNEVDGEDYHFITEEEFRERVEKGFFLEHREYNAEFGHCLYGSSWESYEESQPWVVILHPDNLDPVKDLYPNAAVVYLKPRPDVIMSRAEHRGDDGNEVMRRYFSDYYSFARIGGCEKYDLMILDTDNNPQCMIEKLLAKFNILKLVSIYPEEYMHVNVS